MNSNFSPLSTQLTLIETAPRRIEQGELQKLQIELQSMKALFKTYSHFNDELTLLLKTWADDFEKSLKLREETLSRVLENRIALLKDYLIDPILTCPLDQECFIGNDGKTYSRISLTVTFYFFQSEEVKNELERLKDWQPVTSLEDHFIASYFVKWLADHNAWHPDPDIQEIYDGLLSNRCAPILPTKMGKRIIALQQSSLSLAVQNTIAQANLTLSNLTASMNNNLRLLAEERQNITNQLLPYFEKLELLKLSSDEQKKLLEDIVKQVTVKIANEIKEIEEENELLKQRLIVLDKKTEELKVELIHLQIAHNNLRKQAKKRKKGFFKGLLKVCGVAAGCMIGSHILASTGFSLKAGSIGATLNYTFKI
ncbi:MAG: hypothetical protein BGO10_06625 [Chlamydia sp. 32-24]|nr:MAG: hypothetical protein BGO10_06625 [Chlamydia sp. 32-24]